MASASVKARLKALRKKYHLGEFKTKHRIKKYRSVTHMARRRHYGRKHSSHSKMGGFNLGGALKILAGAAIAAAYEIFVSPMIPLSSTVKNIVELVLGILLMTMKGMPIIVRAGGAALATINAYQLIYPLISGSGSGTSSLSYGGM